MLRPAIELDTIQAQMEVNTLESAGRAESEARP